MKNEKIANVNISIKKLFFSWLEITRPFHKLTKQNQSVLALLLYYHYVYSSEVKNKKLLWKLVFETSTRMLIREELGIEDSSFQNVLSNLRKKNIINNNTIVSTYITNLEQDAKVFRVLFNFNIVDEPREEIESTK